MIKVITLDRFGDEDNSGLVFKNLNIDAPTKDIVDAERAVHEIDEQPFIEYKYDEKDLFVPKGWTMTNENFPRIIYIAPDRVQYVMIVTKVMGLSRHTYLERMGDKDFLDLNAD